MHLENSTTGAFHLHNYSPTLINFLCVPEPNPLSLQNS